MHERDNERVHTSPQKVEIHLTFIGEFEIPDKESEPTPEEIEIEKRRAKDRERYRRNYLKRKGEGYYEKTVKGKSMKTKEPKAVA